uniref:Uncharacterized protein n=1 Tax=Chromera velia CCMP2878 TaxID=1169474 RepID=A0A0G4HZQ6_9ALVE|eukprot:Cvel_9781.t1-p1 / transcript=Cvel_9781.t1 / gene=Cvel_9781 / organism=Chromera_velia_CCMP2878 / gene_product=hypothetical protein / transcript_product=hypothetical protein / location=Cvel_scaffold573:71994-77886(-) / protein_length=493 / sequence_SO=supercontig / SO=protein_coding / is_pseudo=false
MDSCCSCLAGCDPCKRPPKQNTHIPAAPERYPFPDTEAESGAGALGGEHPEAKALDGPSAIERGAEDSAEPNSSRSPETPQDSHRSPRNQSQIRQLNFSVSETFENVGERESKFVVAVLREVISTKDETRVLKLFTRIAEEISVEAARESGGAVSSSSEETLQRLWGNFNNLTEEERQRTVLLELNLPENHRPYTSNKFSADDVGEGGGAPDLGSLAAATQEKQVPAAAERVFLLLENEKEARERTVTCLKILNANLPDPQDNKKVDLDQFDKYETEFCRDKTKIAFKPQWGVDMAMRAWNNKEVNGAICAHTPNDQNKARCAIHKKASIMQCWDAVTYFLTSQSNAQTNLPGLGERDLYWFKQNVMTTNPQTVNALKGIEAGSVVMFEEPKSTANNRHHIIHTMISLGNGLVGGVKNMCVQAIARAKDVSNHDASEGTVFQIFDLATILEEYDYANGQWEDPMQGSDAEKRVLKVLVNSDAISKDTFCTAPE